MVNKMICPKCKKECGVLVGEGTKTPFCICTMSDEIKEQFKKLKEEIKFPSNNNVKEN